MAGVEIALEDVLRDLLRDRPFYETSGGGITVSGGEPLDQPAFVFELLSTCKKYHLHTVLDTSGYGEWHDLQKLLEYTDLILYDLKLIDAEKHRKYTGVPNKLILENVNRIAQYRPSSLIVRFPFVPEINDSREDVNELINFLKSISFKRFDILPYHRLGVAKYKMLGGNYRLGGIKQPTKDQIGFFKTLLMEMGIEAHVEF